MCTLPPHVPIIIKIFMNQLTSHSLVGAPLDLMYSTFYDKGITLYLISKNLRYSVSVHIKNNFSVFTFITTSASFFKIFFITFRWSTNFIIVITITLSMCAHTILKPLNNLDTCS